MSDCTVYIDESGDLGAQRGTQWFVLTAVVVDKTDEALIRARMNQIKTRLNIKEIHLKKVRDFYKRAFIVHELSDLPFTYMNILVDTNKFDTSKIPSTLTAYNFICKYLLQRVSWYLSENKKEADIVLSARGNSDDNKLIKYIREKLLPYPTNNIDPTVFDKISAKTASSWDLLQLADVCATSTLSAYEIKTYGFIIPCFSIALSEHLYRKDGKLESYGIKFFQNDMKPDIHELKKKRICIQKERTPGATTT